jgi:hypothetical protein
MQERSNRKTTCRLKIAATIWDEVCLKYNEVNKMYLSVGTFEDLMHGYAYAEIYSRGFGHALVRRLSVAAGKVQIDALIPPIISVSLNTEITYEPWFMDRGSLLFEHPELPKGGKICTELDEIRFPDGKRYEILHKDSPK